MSFRRRSGGSGNFDGNTSQVKLELPPQVFVYGTRNAYTYEALQEAYPRVHLQPRSPQELPGDAKKGKCCAKLSKVFPILKSFKTGMFWSDVWAGLLVGFLIIPQSLAYSLLADLPLVSGVYTSLIPVIVYTLFGTSVHTSMGTNSIVSIITADIVHRELDARMDDFIIKNSTGTVQDTKAIEEFKLGVAMASAFVSGILFLLMGIFRLGFLTSYLPSSFIGGFTMGAGVVIGTTQLTNALNIKAKRIAGWGKVLQTYAYILTHLDHTHFVDLIIASSSLLAIMVFTNVINPKLKSSRFGMEIPINLAIIVIATFVSFVLDLSEEYDVAIIGEVPSEFPSPVLPVTDKSLVKNIMLDCVLLVLSTFSLNVSMAMLIGRIHHQEVYPNKELIAYGMCNLLSSPFQCHVSSTSPARCMLLHNDNAKSMFHSVSTVILLLVVILGLGHSLRFLPIAVLAAIVIAAIRGLVMQGKQLPNLWRVSKSDFVIWVSTFSVTTFVDVEMGLIFGIAMAFIVVVVTSQRAKGYLIVKSVSEEVFIHGQNRTGVNHLPNVRIFFFPAQLCFFNADFFKAQLYKEVWDPNGGESKGLSYDIDSNLTDLVMTDDAQTVRCIILDCSAMTHIDMDGINMLKLIVVMYHKAGVQILMVRCLQNVYETLDRADFFSILPAQCVFYDLSDALRYEQSTREGVTRLTVKLIRPGKSGNAIQEESVDSQN